MLLDQVGPLKVEEDVTEALHLHTELNPEIFKVAQKVYNGLVLML